VTAPTAYNIARSYVVEPVGKNRFARSAAQQLSDCFENNGGSGKFLSSARIRDEK
jgi:hypothetical protein